MRSYFLMFFTGVLLSSCQTYSESQIDDFDNQIKAYIDKNHIDCERSNSGLYFKILEKGEGRKVKYKDVVRFTYTGQLLDGTVFDEQSEPVEFHVAQLIAAWKEIMLELNQGGKAYLICPPQLAYGDHQLDDIPQNSILIFNMEVVEVI